MLLDQQVLASLMCLVTLSARLHINFFFLDRLGHETLIYNVFLVNLSCLLAQLLLLFIVNYMYFVMPFYCRLLSAFFLLF